MSDSAHPQVLILCNDLFFTSQLTGAVQRAGWKPRTCLSQTGCLQALTEHGPHVRWIVIDLEMPQLDLSGIKAAAGETCRLLAFGPHVHTAQLNAARLAGCDLVLTRGQVSSDLATILHEPAE